MKYIVKIWMLALPLLLAGCVKDEPGGQQADGGIAFEINFAEKTESRMALDVLFNSTWEDGDRVGIYAVERGRLPAEGDNYIDNVALTYDAGANTWTPSPPLHWPHDGTALDFYAYYPYHEAFDPGAYAFGVLADQSGTTDDRSNFSLSDMLTAEADNDGKGYAKGTASVPLSFSHIMAMVQTTLDNGTGLLDTNSEIVVTLKDVYIAAPGAKGDITMYRVEQPGTPEYTTTYTYRALLPPGQTFAAGTSLFRITDGTTILRSAPLAEPLTLVAGQVETFGQQMPSPDPEVGVTFIEGEPATVTASQPKEGLYVIDFGGTGDKLVYSITLKGKTYLIGRKDNETVTLKLDADGNLQLREAVDDGSGTPKIPVGTYDELRMIGQAANLGGHYLQEGDLDLFGLVDAGSLNQPDHTVGNATRQNWTPIGKGDNPFNGSYDGGGHTIANLYINTTISDEFGLFGCVGTDGSLSRIGIVSGSVTGVMNIGGVCGWNFGAITACYNMSTVSGHSNIVGGVCGRNDGAITACYNAGVVEGYLEPGGLCGHNNGAITACYNTGTVRGDDYIGGLCSINGNGGTITACYNTGTVEGVIDIGEVCGWNLGAITTCFYLDRGIEDPNGTKFSVYTGWPTTDMEGWATGDGTTGYWKALSPNPLGRFVDGGNPFGINSIFPKLWWEED